MCNSVRPRTDFIDLAKGFGIFLVIMGHTIFPIHEAISLFHMPLFFVLAGITLKIYTNFEIFTLKKINRIFVPYLFFSILSWLVARLVGFNGQVFNGPLWFLQTLFIGIILSELIVKHYKNQCMYLIIALVIFAWFSSKTKYQFFPYDKDFVRVIRSIIFILIGFKLKEFIIIDRRKKEILIIAVILMLIWSVLTYISIFKMGACGSFLDGNIYDYNIFVYYLTAMSGVLMVIFISKILEKQRFINWVGRNSLIIMCVHYPFLQWWNPMISSISFYKDGNLINKGLIALLSYVAALLFSCALIPLFKKTVPQLTGFKNLLSVDKTK